jgi:hypothetical protein
MRRAHELKESTLQIPEERLRVAYVRMTAPAEAIMELIRLIAQSHGMNIVESNPSAAPLLHFHCSHDKDHAHLFM